ncbi:MAG TPA: hypothetical protein VN765_02270 [Candidatus Acidoferrum sp.]|nr:hypothetical protein [Candidatus Acidoferrum sp.]
MGAAKEKVCLRPFAGAALVMAMLFFVIIFVFRLRLQAGWPVEPGCLLDSSDDASPAPRKLAVSILLLLRVFLRHALAARGLLLSVQNSSVPFDFLLLGGGAGSNARRSFFTGL